MLPINKLTSNCNVIKTNWTWFFWNFVLEKSSQNPFYILSVIFLLRKRKPRKYGNLLHQKSAKIPFLIMGYQAELCFYSLININSHLSKFFPSHPQYFHTMRCKKFPFHCVWWLKCFFFYMIRETWKEKFSFILLLFSV